MEEATQLIEAGIKDSYVVARKNEILIMDNPLVESAINVIRMNKNGIAFSQSGYNGPYTLAITIDGKINASCITTGELNAALIKTGFLMSANNKTWINMEDGTFNFGDKIKFDGNSFTVDITGEDLNDNASMKLIIDKLQIEYKDADKKLEGSITQTAESLRSEYKDADKKLEGSITQTAESLRTEYKDIQKGLESQIQVNAEAIKTKFSSADFESYKTQTAKYLESEFKNTKEGLEGKITQTAESLKSDYTNKTNTLQGTITQTATNLTSDYTDKVNKVNSSLTQTASAIRAEVASADKQLSSKIEINANAIKQKVESKDFEAYKTHTDREVVTKVKDLQNRVDSAEQKITSKEILNAINYEIDKGGAISTTSTKLEKGKFTIYNGSLIVQNNKNKDVMWCNTEGWLTTANLFINGTENPSNLEIGGSNGNKGVGIRTNGAGYSAYLDFGVLDRNATFDENVRTGQYHRFITEASDRSMLNLVTPHFNIRPFTGYGPVELTVQGYIEAFHDISTRHNINAVGEITAGGFKRKDTNYSLIASDTVDTIKYAKNDKSYLEVKTPKFGTWGVDIWASDTKLKENIQQLDLNKKIKDKTVNLIGLDLINHINHYSYDYIESFGGEHISCGYVAQELKELNSNLVLEVKQEDGSTILQPSAPNIIPNITFALQQQQAEIERLKREIEDLKTLIK